MGDGVRIPAFGEHGHRNHAANRIAQTTYLAHRVHHLAQQVLLADALAGLGVTGALDDFAAESLDLVGRHTAKAIVQRVTGFELLAVNQQCSGATQCVAVLVVVAE